MPFDYPDGRHIVTKQVVQKGYLPTAVETHNETNCQYVSAGVETVSTANYWGYGSYSVYKNKRQCYCGRYPYVRTELHYEDNCKWKKVVDQTDGKSYLYRRCFCQKRN